MTATGSEDHGCLVALTPAGQLDAGFNGGAGYLVPDLDGPGHSTYFRDVAVQGSSIVAAGFTNAPGEANGLVARYTLAGQLDTTFGTGGVYLGPDGLTGYYHLAVAADRSLVVAGERDLPDGTRLTLVGHLSAGGVPDTSFGTDGTGFTVAAPAYQNLPAMPLDAWLSGGTGTTG